MKSSQIITIFVVAIVLAAISYFAASFIGFDNVSLAIGAFVGAIVSPFISAGKQSHTNSEASEEITTLYVGNLPYRANEASVRELFANYGVVHSVRLMKDKHTGKRRGFGFVEMSANHADSAINSLNDSEFQQRTLKVREAKDRPDNSDND